MLNIGTVISKQWMLLAEVDCFFPSEGNKKDKYVNESSILQLFENKQLWWRRLIAVDFQSEKKPLKGVSDSQTQNFFLKKTNTKQKVNETEFFDVLKQPHQSNPDLQKSFDYESSEKFHLFAQVFHEYFFCKN